jgi:hypothetical protein
MTAVQELVYLLNEAFSGRGIEETNESQSLLVNLSSVGEANWRTPPPGGTRTVESIALHVGTCKLMYDEYAFGPGKLTWDDPHLQPWPEGEAPMSQVISGWRPCINDWSTTWPRSTMRTWGRSDRPAGAS